MSNDASAARAKRHDELWRGSSRSMGRLFIGSLIFGAMILFRVFGPYTDNLDLLARAHDKETAAQTRLESVDERLAWATDAANEVESVSAKIGRQPWNEGADKLRTSIAALVDDAKTLKQIPQEDVKTLRIAPAIRRPNTAELTRQLPPTERTRQVPPGDGDRRRLERLPVDGDRPAGDPRVVDAADRLRIGKQDLTHPRDAQQWRAFVDDRLRDAARDGARESIGKMRTTTETDVIAPLRRVVKEAGPEFAGSAALDANLDELEQSLEHWDGRYGQRDDWYKTVEGKGEAFAELGSELTRYQSQCRDVTNDLLAGLEAEKAAVDAERVAIESEVGDIVAQIADTETALQEALPAWLRGLVTIDNAIQLFPAAVLGLLTLGAWYAVRTRRHFLIVRRALWASGVDPTEPAMSTAWTLVYRRAIGTAVTIGLYGVALAVGWYLVSEAVVERRQWLEARPEGAVILGPAEVAAGVAGWLGPLLCAAALVAAIVVLFTDYKSCQKPGRLADST